MGALVLAGYGKSSISSIHHMRGAHSVWWAIAGIKDTFSTMNMFTNYNSSELMITTSYTEN